MSDLREVSPGVYVEDDVRRYDVLADRVNVYRQKLLWRADARGECTVIESTLIGYHERVPEDGFDFEHGQFFVKCAEHLPDGMERFPTGPFIPLL